MDKCNRGSSSKGLGNSAKLAKLIVASMTEQVNVSSEGELLVQGDAKVADH